MTTQASNDDAVDTASVVPLPGASPASSGPFATPNTKSEYTDGRAPGDWQSRYPKEARRCINEEACILAGLLVLVAAVSGLFLAMASDVIVIPIDWLAPAPGAPAPILTIDFKVLMTFAVGSLGGTTFSIKWLIHSAAKCKWNLDRRYWRFFVPLIGGVYACVMLTLLDGGMFGERSAHPRSVALTAALAFLVGYFSDGVSGLLSNIANAVFGTLEKK